MSHQRKNESHTQYCERIYLEAKKKKMLYVAEPVDWMWMPKWLRSIVGIVTMTIFASCFLVGAILPIFLIPWVWQVAPIFSTICVASVAMSLILPQREWILARKIGQLWYEPLHGLSQQGVH